MYSARFFRSACLLPFLIITASAIAQSFSCTVEQAPSDPASLAFAQQNYPRLFLLNSGANQSILSVTAAKSVGKVHTDYDDEIVGLNGRVKKIYMADKVDVIFAGLRDPLRDVLLMSLDGPSSDSGIEISGIIGLDTLSLLTVDVDYRDGLVHIVYDPNHGRNKAFVR